MEKRPVTRRLMTHPGVGPLTAGAAAMTPVADNPAIVPTRELEEEKKLVAFEPPRIGGVKWLP